MGLKEAWFDIFMKNDTFCLFDLYVIVFIVQSDVPREEDKYDDPDLLWTLKNNLFVDLCKSWNGLNFVALLASIVYWAQSAPVYFA